MKITDCPCENCRKRSVDCRAKCGAYKVYHYNKSKEYEQNKERGIILDAYYENVHRNKNRRRKRDGYGSYDSKRRKIT